MFTEAGIVLGVMVAVYAAARAFRLATELAMVAAALGGAIAGGYWFPARQVAEGAATYLDINLIFITATLFMNLLKESGGVAFVVRGILRRFHRQRALLLAMLSLVLLVPGALTGRRQRDGAHRRRHGGHRARLHGHPPRARGGDRVHHRGPERRGAARQPVGDDDGGRRQHAVRRVLLAAAAALPAVAALFTSFLLGWKGTTADIDKALAELPEAPAGMAWWKVLAPFVVFLGLVFMGRQWPYSTPVVGLPLMFAAAALVSWALSPVPLRVVRVARDTIEQLLPLLATLTCAGILVQVMTLTGARGLMAVTAVTLPVVVVYATLFVVLPLSEAVLMWGSAPVIGVPLVLLFNTIWLEPDRGPRRHEPHLAPGRRAAADGHHRPAHREHRGLPGTVRLVPEGLRRAGGSHRDSRYVDGDLQREAGVDDGAVARGSKEEE